LQRGNLSYWSYGGSSHALLDFDAKTLDAIQKILNKRGPQTGAAEKTLEGLLRAAGSSQNHYLLDLQANGGFGSWDYTPSNDELNALNQYLVQKDRAADAKDNLRGWILNVGMPAARFIYGAADQGKNLVEQMAGSAAEMVTHPIDTLSEMYASASRGLGFIGLGFQALFTDPKSALADFGSKAQVWWGQVSDDFKRDPAEFLGRRFTDLVATYFAAKGTVQGSQQIVSGAKNLPGALRRFWMDESAALDLTAIGDAFKKFNNMLDNIGEDSPLASSLASKAENPLDEIANFRKQRGLPEYAQNDGATGTVARTEIEGSAYYGVNSSLDGYSISLDAPSTF
jgi:hypothetical protein